VLGGHWEDARSEDGEVAAGQRKKSIQNLKHIQ
jgi:hypothetical protein